MVNYSNKKCGRCGHTGRYKNSIVICPECGSNTLRSTSGWKEREKSMISRYDRWGRMQ